MKYEFSQLCAIDIEVIDGDRGKNYPHQNELTENGECLFLSSKNVTQSGFSLSDNQFITKEKDELLNKGKLNRGDIVITTRGTVGNVALYSDDIPYENIRINSGMLIVRCGEDIDNFYLYQVLRSKWFYSQILSIQSGSAQPQLPKSHFLKMIIPLPDMITQRKMAAVLSGVCDKIALNTAINENLFEQIMTIYKLLFAQSAIEKEVNLIELCNFQEGYVNPAQTHPEYFDGEVKWLRAVDINESFIINTSRTLTQIGFESAKKSALLFEPNTIAISKSGTIGRLGIISDYMCGNRAVINIKPKTPELLAFLYCYLKSRQLEFDDLAVGSVQKNLYVSLLESLIVPLPEKNSIASFSFTANSMLSTIRNNCKENNNLVSLRDTLLPKLMNGEIDVSEVKI